MAPDLQTDNNKMLNNSEERYRALVNATSDVVYRMSPDWSVLWQMEGGGFMPDTKTPEKDWEQKYIHPVDHQKVKAAIIEAIQRKQIFELEHRVLLADGTTGWTASTAVPILNEQGNIKEWFGAARNITARKRMEEALERSLDEAGQHKQLNEIVAANTPDLIYVFDTNYIFTYANPALLNMWGKTWDESIGKGLLENGYEPWHAEMHEREIDQVIETKQAIRGEVSFPHATLGRRVYDYIFSPVINAQGEVEAIAGTTRDISDIKENEQRKNDFISMVSHELKTPLTSVISFVQVVQKRVAQNDDTVAAGMLERADRQLQKMTRMINGFLNVSRLESGTIQIDKQAFDIAQLIKEVEDETNATIFSHPINFKSSEQIWVRADREKISQVFNNLLSNAVKYSPSGSTIDVNYTTKGEFVEVSIRDQGFGISRDDLPRLFERYYRVKEAETNHIAGFGIGLYLCAEILKLHGGKIWAESTPGEGSTFFFTLPLNNAN